MGLVLPLTHYFAVDGLVAFALGTGGSDQQRWQAARHAMHHGLLEPNQPVNIYVSGEQQEIPLIQYNITEEIIPDEGIRAAFRSANAAMEDDNYESALEFANEGLASFPDNVQLHYLKFSCLNHLERDDELKDHTDLMREKFPDHILANVASAEVALNEDDYETAQAILAPFSEVTDMTIDEFGAFAHANIQLHLGLEQKSRARHWITIWQDVDVTDVPMEYRILNMGINEMARMFETMSQKQQLEFLQLMQQIGSVDGVESDVTIEES